MFIAVQACQSSWPGQACRHYAALSSIKVAASIEDWVAAFGAALLTALFVVKLLRLVFRFTGQVDAQFLENILVDLRQDN